MGEIAFVGWVVLISNLDLPRLFYRLPSILRWVVFTPKIFVFFKFFVYGLTVQLVSVKILNILLASSKFPLYISKNE